MEQTFIFLLLAAGIRLGTPLALAGIGETLSQKSGVLNLGLEGYLTIATIIAFAGAYYTGSPWLGTLIAIGASVILALVYGYLTISLGLSQIVAGLGVMLFAGGMSCILNYAFFKYQTPVNTANFEPLSIPILSNIPIAGAIFFQQHILFYLAVVLLAGSWFLLNRTKFGLRIKSVGESASAADAMGTDVALVRYACVIFCGVMAGIAGSHLVLGVTQAYMTGMVDGRGFIVLAAVVLGRWKPLYVFLATYLFGILDALQFRMQIIGLFNIPWEFWIILPYLAAVLALIITGGRRDYVPKELCVPYLREER